MSRTWSGRLPMRPELAREFGAGFDPLLDSVYLGGGTPSVLAADQLDRLFAAVRRVFEIAPGAEFTVEVAPGTLSSEVLAALLRAGVNRVSLGVQSFVDQESRSVGRLHSRGDRPRATWPACVRRASRKSAST